MSRLSYVLQFIMLFFLINSKAYATELNRDLTWKTFRNKTSALKDGTTWDLNGSAALIRKGFSDHNEALIAARNKCMNEADLVGFVVTYKNSLPTQITFKKHPRGHEKPTKTKGRPFTLHTKKITNADLLLRDKKNRYAFILK